MSKKLFTDMIVSEEDAAVVRDITDRTMTITITTGTAIVLDDILRQACVAIAKDALMAHADGDEETAETMAMIGSELITVIDLVNDGINSVDGADELTKIAKRSASSAQMHARASTKQKGTLQ